MPEPSWKRLKIAGALHTDLETRKSYGEDASIHRRLPQAVAFPKNREDLEILLGFCREEGIPIHGWGAGTSRGGQPLGEGLVLNFREFWGERLEYHEETGEVTVGPGVFYSELQKFLKTRGRSFPPDPSYHQCTLAGMVANNAAGIHSVKYGATIEYVAAVEFFTSDGVWHHTDREEELHGKCAAFLKKYGELIEAEYPKVEKNSSGYALNRGLNAQGKTDLPKLLTGSEGTLGLFSELRLRTVPIPQATALGILYFSDLSAALQTALDLRTFNVSACELVDKVLLDLHAQHSPLASGPRHAKKIYENPFLELFYTSRSEAILVVEIEGEDKEEALSKLENAFALQTSPKKKHLASAPEEVLIWELRRHTSPILNRLEDGRVRIKPLWAVEDVSLPAATLLPYVKEQQKLFEKYGLVCSFFGHAASANLHMDPVGVDPRLSREDSAMADLYDRVAQESYTLTVKYGGSIAGEHGDGFTRTPFLPLQYPRAHKIFPEFKKIFDPLHLLNPGKIVP